MGANFVNALRNEDNFTTTTNGAIALKSTNSSLVDLFGSIGALRGRSKRDIETAFSKAFSEDKLLATKMAFYARDIRFGGLGERNTFRVVLKYLANIYPETLKKNLQYIHLFGRWDDLFVLFGTSLEKDVLSVIKEQLYSDIKSENPSLLAKWMPSINTSSKESVAQAKIIAKYLKVTEKEYRKMLSGLRKTINIVERKMSGNEWTDINYSGVPSKAMTLYRKAFKKHDESGFEDYISKLVKGETKINASTLFPYDILEGMCQSSSYFGKTFTIRGVQHDPILEAQWKALPNYVEGENNILIMADTSGSMQGRPMATSVGLAMYFAERNHGVFKDVFMTFSSKPSFVQLKGSTVFEKMRCVPEIVENTNLESAFNLILNTAVTNNLSTEDMPKSLVVISDMQFDNQSSSKHDTWHNAMVNKFAQQGYEMPNIIYWNVNASKDTFQVTSDYKGVQLASGQSASIFKSILANIGYTPYDAMVNTLSNEVYDCITV